MRKLLFAAVLLVVIGFSLWFVPLVKVGHYLSIENDERLAWLPADGQKLRIDGYPELYAAIGTTFGGDGRTTFVMPTDRTFDFHANQRFGKRVLFRCIAVRPLEDGTQPGQMAWCTKEDL